VAGSSREDVDRRAGDMAGLQRPDSAPARDQLAAGAIDQAHAFFGRGKRLGV